MVIAAAPQEIPLRIKLRRGNHRAHHSTAQEMYVEGPARTGKTYALLLRMHVHAVEVPGYRGLIVRKVAATLGSTVLRTLEENVYHDWQPPLRLSVHDKVHFFGGSVNEPPAYVYTNGSRIVVGGMDQPTKILGSEYDEIFYNEVIEGSEEDVETLKSRLSHGLLPHPIFMADCNPSHDRHWVLQRIKRGGVEHITTTLKDNPAFYDLDGEPTERGRAYIANLSGLTGSRYQRLVLGEWVGVENAVYPHFDRSSHVQEIPEGVRFVDGAFGADFGRVHKSATVAVSRDQLGRLWVREAWARPSDDHGGELRRNVAALRQRYSLRRGRVDPNQDVLAGLLGANIAKSGEGSRQHRIDLTSRLLNTYPGGIVPALNAETRGRALPYGPNSTDDTPGLLFVKGAPGIDELCDELEAYHYEHRLTDTKDEMVVARIDEDLVAAMEYAIEELEEYQLPDYSQPLKQAAPSWGAVRTVR